MLLSSLLGLVCALSIGQDYRRLELAVQPTQSESTAHYVIAETQNPLFGAYASSQLSAYLSVSDENALFMNRHLQRALYVTPLPAIVPLRYAEVMQKFGKHSEAELEKRIVERMLPKR